MIFLENSLQTTADSVGQEHSNISFFTGPSVLAVTTVTKHQRLVYLQTDTVWV